MTINLKRRKKKHKWFGFVTFVDINVIQMTWILSKELVKFVSLLYMSMSVLLRFGFSLWSNLPTEYFY